MEYLAKLIKLINIPANIVGEFLFVIISFLPGWLSNTIISAVVGVLILILIKYTSNQKAISRTRDSINSNMLALRLFRDSVSVTLKSQTALFKGALLLLFHAFRPMIIMIIPVSLLIAQMALWYQMQPLLPGKETYVTMCLNDFVDIESTVVDIEDTDAFDVALGPVRVLSKNEVNWVIKAKKPGKHKIKFTIDDEIVEKEMAVGRDFMRVSIQRPALVFPDVLMHPAEKPFDLESPVRSISIGYSERESTTNGANWWIGYFFVVSMVFAFLFKSTLNVKI